MNKKAKLGRPKNKDRLQTTVLIDRAHINRMQGVNRSDVVNVALSDYYKKIDDESTRAVISANQLDKHGL